MKMIEFMEERLFDNRGDSNFHSILTNSVNCLKIKTCHFVIFNYENKREQK